MNTTNIPDIAAELEQVRQVYIDFKVSKGEEPNPVEFRYFDADPTWQNPPDLPQQYFAAVNQEQLRKSIKGNSFATTGLISGRKKFPPVNGFYVQSKSEDGSQFWYWLGATVGEVQQFYDGF